MFCKENRWLYQALSPIILVIVIVCGFGYFQTHQTVDLGDGIKVKVAGYCVYLKDDPGSGGENQFYAFDVSGISGMSMKPHFTLINTSSQAREVGISSLSTSDWKEPVSGKVYLEPGQRFEFQIQIKRRKVWYCWINPIPKKT